MGKLFFNETDIAAAFDAREPNFGQVVSVCTKMHVLLQIVFGDMVSVHGR